MTIPLEGVQLASHKDLIAELEDAGYTDMWTGEANSADAFTPLAAAASWSRTITVGSGIAQVMSRGPAILATHIATLCDLAPGRVEVGIGSSSEVIVQQWNDMPFERPYSRVRDTLRFLRKALAGEKVDEAFDTFEVRAFRQLRLPEVPPRIYVAALKGEMLKLAGREADGAVVNWLSPEDVKLVAREVTAGAAGAAGTGQRALPDIVARLYVVPSEDRATVMRIGRMAMGAYMSVPVYRRFQEWVGRGEAFRDMWRLWDAGERKAAVEAIPEEVVDDLVVHGSPEECMARVQEYIDCGVTIPIFGMLAYGDEAVKGAKALSPGLLD